LNHVVFDKTGLRTVNIVDVKHWLPSVTLFLRPLPWKLKAKKIAAVLMIGLGKKPPPRPRRSKARQTVRIPRYRRIEASVEAHYSY
ncbi:unnamed protein product, partial [Fusarium graminearum]